MRDDYDPDLDFPVEQIEAFEKILMKFKNEVYDKIPKEGATAEHFDDVDFDSLVTGYILAQPESTTTMAAWAWCWHDVVAGSKTVAGLLGPDEDVGLSRTN